MSKHLSRADQLHRRIGMVLPHGAGISGFQSENLQVVADPDGYISGAAIFSRMLAASSEGHSSSEAEPVAARVGAMVVDAQLAPQSTELAA